MTYITSKTQFLASSSKENIPTKSLFIFMEMEKISLVASIFYKNLLMHSLLVYLPFNILAILSIKEVRPVKK